MQISMLAAAGLVAVSLVACGGSSARDGDESAGGAATGGESGSHALTTVSTTIPDQTLASELTEAQMDELCGAVIEVGKAVFSSREFKSTVCGEFAYMTFEDQGGGKECEDFYQACLDTPDLYDGSAPGQCTRPSSTCSATVGEIEACWSDLFAVTMDPSNDQSCAAIGKESSGWDQSPASCKSLKGKCPEAVDGVTGPDFAGIRDRLPLPPADP